MSTNLAGYITIQALMTIWAELPNLAGEQWAQMYTRLNEARGHWLAATDDEQRRSFAGEIQQILGENDEVLKRFDTEHAALRKARASGKKGTWDVEPPSEELGSSVEQIINTIINEQSIPPVVKDKCLRFWGTVPDRIRPVIAPLFNHFLDTYHCTTNEKKLTLIAQMRQAYQDAHE